MNTNFYASMYQLPRKRWGLKPWMVVAGVFVLGYIAGKVVR